MSVADQLQELKKKFLTQLPEKARVVQTAVENALASGADSVVRLEAYRQVHTLAGTSGTYGFDLVCRAARTLMLHMGSDGTEIAAHAEQVRGSIKVLISAVERAELPSERDTRITRVRPRETPSTEENRLVFVVDPDEGARADLAAHLRPFGYDVRTYPALEDVREAMEGVHPAVVLVDSRAAGGAFQDGCRPLREREIPVVVLSDRTDYPHRLDAVRAGAKAFVKKPVDAVALVERLDGFTARRTPEPYRVLIIDDDPAVAEHHAVVLQSAGMRTSIVTEPLTVARPLEELSPDLILMDLYMPACSGLELASVIRQQDEYVGTPIIFLSMESEIEKHLEAQQAGGDIFLTKPVDLDRLLGEVSTRVERARVMRKFMVRDSLTGLLNHTTIMAQLDIEVARARRRKSTLGFAMLDLDHFKSVNDTHGHVTGDKVLRSLSRVLGQRLRRTDLIGRAGGEEFAVVLLDSGGDTSFTVMEEIRAKFEALKHASGGKEFGCTFSCGLASMPPHNDAATLRDLADKALYRAKAEGRNRVVLAGP